MTTKPLQVKRTDWYEIVPLGNGFFALVVEGIVREIPSFPSLDAAEDYILFGGLS